MVLPPEPELPRPPVEPGPDIPPPLVPDPAGPPWDPPSPRPEPEEPVGRFRLVLHG